MKRRVGLVGAGYICEDHIAAIRRLPGVELVGITDLDTARAQKTAEKFGVTVFPSLKALKEAGANAIHVLTPPHTHTAITLEALDLGCDVLALPKGRRDQIAGEHRDQRVKRAQDAVVHRNRDIAGCLRPVAQLSLRV